MKPQACDIIHAQTDVTHAPAEFPDTPADVTDSREAPSQSPARRRPGFFSPAGASYFHTFSSKQTFFNIQIFPLRIYFMLFRLFFRHPRMQFFSSRPSSVQSSVCCPLVAEMRHYTQRDAIVVDIFVPVHHGQK